MPMTGNRSDISLYFHIPFCTRKCDYCHFYVIPDNESDKDILLAGFLSEWERALPSLLDMKAVTLYFGGGTPSLFGPERLSKLIETVRESVFLPDDAEITIEANPENISVELMKKYAEAGVNRASIGIQTLDPDLLKLLGRMHDPQTALNAVHDTHQAGIRNISVDLMYDLPGQTGRHWVNTLNRIETLPVSHLSLYNLTIEPHTVFFKKRKELTPLLPDEEAGLLMYETAVEKLEAFSLKQYEISAFAKPGYESKHNSGYWTGRPFLGLGPSAFSFRDGKRFRNIANLRKYAKLLNEGKSPVDFEERLDPEAHRRELFVIRLRLLAGVSLSAFTSLHGRPDNLMLSNVDRLASEGFLIIEEDRIRLSKKGILFYDTVAAELI